MHGERALPCAVAAQDADGRWWPCVLSAGHGGFHWYNDR